MGTEASPTALAISSSTELLSLALQYGGACYTQSIAGGPSASSQILPAIEALCAQAGSSLQSIQQLAIDRGPGAFTGVRVAVAVGQGLAVATGAQLYAFSSLRLLLEELVLPKPPAEGDAVWAVFDARMGQVYAAQALWQEGRWQMQTERLLDYGEMAKEIAGSPCIGNISKMFAEQGLPLPASYQEAQPQAASMLALLRQPAEAARALCASPAQLLPVYVRNQVALTTAEREAAKAASMMQKA